MIKNVIYLISCFNCLHHLLIWSLLMQSDRINSSNLPLPSLILAYLEILNRFRWYHFSREVGNLIIGKLREIIRAICWFLDQVIECDCGNLRRRFRIRFPSSFDNWLGSIYGRGISCLCLLSISLSKHVGFISNIKSKVKELWRWFLYSDFARI
jgi:hypothetical protein